MSPLAVGNPNTLYHHGTYCAKLRPNVPRHIAPMFVSMRIANHFATRWLASTESWLMSITPDFETL